MKSRMLSLLCLLGLCVSVVWAQEPMSLDLVLDRMNAEGMNFRNLQADIARTKVVVFVNDRTTDSGRVYFSGGGNDSQIRLTITSPAPQDLLVSGGKAQLYRPRINRVEEYDLSERRDVAEFLMIGFGRSNQTLGENYEVTLVGEENVGGIPASVLDLKPRSDRVAGLFPTIRLWIDQNRWIPVRSRLNEASGDYQIVEYSNILINGRIPRNAFDLDLPRDVVRQ